MIFYLDFSCLFRNFIALPDSLQDPNESYYITILFWTIIFSICKIKSIVIFCQLTIDFITFVYLNISFCKFSIHNI